MARLVAFNPGMHIERRRFVGMVTGASAASLTGSHAFAGEEKSTRLLLGYDNFAVRALKWKAPQLIDYAVKLKVDSLFITDLHAFDSLEDKALAEIRKKAADAGVRLYLGTWSICPTSVTFRDTWGTADEHLLLGIRAAKALGSPVLRVVLGSRDDRRTEGGIAARIADTVKVLKRNRTKAIDAGIKIAMENHAGDMHSLELKGLVEEAGPDFVGVNLDAGNAVWTLEDPTVNLQNLGKHVLTTSLRDTAWWESENGVTAQWTAMGEGMVDWKEYFALFAKLCPKAPVHIETISGAAREMKVNDKEFWKAWPNGKPKGYDQFLEAAKKGKAPAPRPRPKGEQGQQEYQKAEIERSIAYCKKIGLGRR